MTKFKNPITIILLFSFFLISTCTTNNSITGNSDQSLGKTTGVVEINSLAGGDNEWERILQEQLSNYKNRMLASYSTQLFFLAAFDVCMNFVLGIADDSDNDTGHHNQLSKSYDFRDNYLTKSDKGLDYIFCYYIISKYGFENNLVNKYYKEHYELLQNSIEIAYDLQHGSNTNSIMINKSTRDDLKDMLKVYRNSLNHREIDPILNYLEADLEKYYNIPKYEIAADFEQN